MSAPPASSGPVGRLDQVLLDLDAVCAESKGDAQQLLAAEEAKSALTKLRSIMKRTQLEQVAELVQDFKWDEATEQMERNFPGGTTNIGLVEEILALVYVDTYSDHLVSSIEWVGRLDVWFQPKAYQLLFQQMKSKGHTDLPQVLLLSEKISKLPDGVLDGVQAQLDCSKVLEKIIEDVDQDASCYNTSHNIENLHRSTDGERVLREILTRIVHNFDLGNVENMLQLIDYNRELNTARPAAI
jgi:hypothetical protein